MEKIIGKKEKRTNKGTDMPYVVDSLIQNTTYHTQCLYQFQNPRSSSCSEIFDEKKSLHTHKHTEKAKTIYPLYTSYTGGIITPTLLAPSP